MKLQCKQSPSREDLLQTAASIILQIIYHDKHIFLCIISKLHYFRTHTTLPEQNETISLRIQDSNIFKGCNVTKNSHVPHIRDIISLNNYKVNRISHVWRLRPLVIASVYQNSLRAVHAKEKASAWEQCSSWGLLLWLGQFAAVGFLSVLTFHTIHQKRQRSDRNWFVLVGYPGLRSVERMQDNTGALFTG